MESSDIFERMHRITQPIDYESILKSGMKYEDPDFPPDNSSLFSISILWEEDEEAENDDYDEEIEIDPISEAESCKESTEDQTLETSKEQTPEPIKEPNKGMLSDEKRQKWKDEFEWRRLSDIYDDYEVLGTNVGAQDIKQGALGDCYFLSALAAIVTNAKEQLFKMFMIDKGFNAEPKQTIYAIRLLVNGKYEIIVIDDYVPYNKVKCQPAFCSTYSKNIWAILLEKAFAKLNGSYEDIISGKATEALGFMLPYSIKYFDHYNYSKEQLEKIWKRIMKRSTSGLKSEGSK